MGVMKFYTVDTVQVTNVGETLTQEVSITVPADSTVNLDFVVPVASRGFRVYRSLISNEEVLLAEVLFEDVLMIKPVVSYNYRFSDNGSLATNLTEYPLTTPLTSEEQTVYPVPEVTPSLSGEEGLLAADTYFYRVSFLSSAGIWLPFTEAKIKTRLYTEDGSTAIVTSEDTLTSYPAYDELPDPFTYIDSFYTDVEMSTVASSLQSYPAQEIVVGGNIYVLPLDNKISVYIGTKNRTVLKDKPVNVFLFPADVEVELLENELVGTGVKYKGVFTKVFNDEGSVAYFLTKRAQVFFNLSNSAFKVV